MVSEENIVNQTIKINVILLKASGKMENYKAMQEQYTEMVIIIWECIIIIKSMGLENNFTMIIMKREYFKMISIFKIISANVIYE